LPGITHALKASFGVCLFMIAALVFPASKKEVAAPKNPDWTLVITAADVSALAVSRQSIGDLINRSLVNALNTVNKRIRETGEYAYYEDYAWSKARTDAAKKLETKRADRDKLVYQGLPEWKYQKSLQTIDAEIEKLEADLARTIKETPFIEERPVFKLGGTSAQGTFPAAPKTGGEYQFCVKQNADGFLRLVVSDFQGRTHLSIRLYTRAKAWGYEDSVIFSVEDTQTALNEVAARFVGAISGVPPGALAIRTEPVDALILVDGAFASIGELSATEYPPGEVVIESYADNHTMFSTTFEINSGELADLFINLSPLGLESLMLDTREMDASLYRGALYVGQTPFTLDIPSNQMEYFYMKNDEGEAKAVVSGGITELVTMELQPFPDPEEKRVAQARRAFYNAFGRFWIALPIAVVFGAMAEAERTAYNYLSDHNQDLYDSAVRDYYISIGLWVVFGLTAAESIYRIFRYTHVAGEKSPQIIKK
jgi:hypothetical protein